MRRFVVGTGGHIDHGKTALVGALTGEDTDRLPEEKARGISIDLGFSHLAVDDDVLSIVDVPGHEDFIRNMLAGASGIDVLLLVVAADEGVMPQTREHLAIADLLAVPRAVVALTKADVVEEEWLELVRLDVAELLEGTRFEDAPVLATSATTGQGLDTLRQLLRDAGAGTRRDDADLFRLPVDRAFTIHGTGTVVTGTVWSGSLAVEDEVRVLPDGSTARVRGLQVHGAERRGVVAGERAAVALGGVDRHQVARGATLVTHPSWQPATMLTARLRLIPGTGWRIRQRQRVRVHLGTAEAMARVRLLDGAGGDPREIAPGAEAWAQLRLETPLVARAGDRVVVRSYSPVTTIGGGRVAEAGIRKRKRLDAGEAQLLGLLADGPARNAVDSLLRRAGSAGMDARAFPLELAAAPARVAELLASLDAATVGGRVFTSGAIDDIASALRATLADHHADRPLAPGLELEELRRAAPDGSAPALVEAALDRLREAGQVVVREGTAALATFQPTLTPEQERDKDAIAERIRSAGAEPPTRDEIAAAVPVQDIDALLRLLELDGSILRIGQELYMDRSAADELVGHVRERLGGRSGLGPADFRSVIPVSRKYLIPILEHLDARRVTVRQGDGRSVPAPRA